MKMNKKVLGLVLAGMLSVPFVGCGNKEIEVPPQPQEQQEQPVEPTQPQPTDEDLNDQYLNNVDQVQYAKQLIDQVMRENFQGVQYTIMEENGELVMVINIEPNDPAFTSMDTWNELVGIIIQYDCAIQQYLQQNGVNVQTSTLVGNFQSDTPVLAIKNGEVMYDLFNGIDHLGIGLN